MPRRLTIGSRRSALARLQAYAVAAALRKARVDIAIEFFFKESSGDLNLQTPLWQMPERGVFTKDLSDDLLQNRCDVVIHSHKDLDTQERDETQILSILPRADQRDLLLFKESAFEEPANRTLIHSSSPRREYNLTRFLSSALPASISSRPIEFAPIRGNIQTRLRKFLADEGHGFVIAAAALERVFADPPAEDQGEFRALQNQFRELMRETRLMLLPLSENPNAPAQGGLAAEVRRGDDATLEAFKELSHSECASHVKVERDVLGKYGGGCHQKIGVASLKIGSSEYLFARGATDNGETLDRKERDGDHFDAQASTHGHYVGSPLARTPQAIFVDAMSKLPGTVSSDKVVATADTLTWYRLAAQDIWVTATADGLGPDHLLWLEDFLKKSRWN